MEVALSAQALTKLFGDLPALDKVTLSAQRGSLTALVGPDGAGKTTLLRMAAGLLRPDHGSLQVLGLDVGAHPQAVQDRISYMPQRFGLYEDLSVQENLDLYADLHGVPMQTRRERYDRLLHMMDMQRFTARLAGQLSGGMKQKLGLACTLVRAPELLLLDEPTVGVDPLSRRELWEIVDTLVREQSLSVIVSTAYLDEAERCHQVWVMRNGQVIAGGTPAALRAQADGLCHIATPSAGVRRLLADLDQHGDIVADAVPSGGQVRVLLRPGADIATLGLLTRAVDARLEDAIMLMLASGQNHDPRPPVRTAPAIGADTVIAVKDLVRRFGDFTAVANTSFSVTRGEIFGLLGPNGAGKTTTFRMLCGLLPASSGHLEVAGVNLRHARAHARSKLGYVAQKFALYGNLTVRENLEFFGGAYGLYGQRLAQRIDHVRTRFDLHGREEMPASQLPGGFRQRLSMAVGLLHEPDILFLDEPTSGADPQARRSFWRGISELADQGVTIIVTTHFMEEAEYCDRVLIQDAGRVLALGTPAEVRHQAGDAQDMEQAFIGIILASRKVREAA
jgi:ABC-2 type transport system ATP-binding protein